MHRAVCFVKVKYISILSILARPVSSFPCYRIGPVPLVDNEAPLLKEAGAPVDLNHASASDDLAWHM